jgi:hypothetical protein
MRRKFFNSIRPGLPSLRFGYTADTCSLQFRTITGALLTLKTSDGSLTNFRDEIVVTFPDSTLKESTITVGDTATVDILNIRSPNLLYLNGPTGTCDIRAFPSLLAFSLVQPLCNRFIGKLPLSISIGEPRLAGKVLDISALDANELRINGSGCVDISYPVGSTYVNLLQIGSHSINVPQVFTNMPKLTTVYMDGNIGPQGGGIGEVDITRCTAITYLSLREAKFNAIKTVPGMALQYVNFIFNDFTAVQSGHAGKPESFVAMVANSLNLNNVDAYNIGLSAAQQVALYDVLIATDTGRARCVFQLIFEQSINAHYNLYTPNSNSRQLEAIVTQPEIIKYNYVRSLGHYIRLTDYIFEAVMIGDTAMQITIANASADITTFGIGSTLNVLASTNGDLFSLGARKVLSGSGKVWTIDNAPNYLGYGGSVGRIQVEAIS